jgi:hypothetical protein
MRQTRFAAWAFLSTPILLDHRLWAAEDGIDRRTTLLDNQKPMMDCSGLLWIGSFLVMTVVYTAT